MKNSRGSSIRLVVEKSPQKLQEPSAEECKPEDRENRANRAIRSQHRSIAHISTFARLCRMAIREVSDPPFPVRATLKKWTWVSSRGGTEGGDGVRMWEGGRMDRGDCVGSLVGLLKRV